MEKTLTEETLQAIEDCGAAEMPITETLEIAEMTESEWKAHPEAGKRYKKGQLKTKIAIRQAIVKGAKSGNPALLKAYQEFATHTEESAILQHFTENITDCGRTGGDAAEFADI